jgi:hypothetical protein
MVFIKQEMITNNWLMEQGEDMKDESGANKNIFLTVL